MHGVWAEWVAVIGAAYVWQMICDLDQASIVVGGVFGVLLSVLYMLLGQLGRTSPRGIKQVRTV